MGLHAQRRCLDPARKQACRYRGDWSRPTGYLRLTVLRWQHGHCWRTRRQQRARSRVGLCADRTPASVRDDWPVAAGDYRAAVQPNPDGERGNAALCVVRGQRSPAKWHRIVTQYGGVVGNADRGRQLHLHCGVSDSTTPAQLTATKTLTLTVVFARRSASDHEPVAAGEIGLPYSQTLTASGGTPPYVWSVVNGAPPNGIALSPSAGCYQERRPRAALSPSL